MIFSKYPIVVRVIRPQTKFSRPANVPTQSLPTAQTAPLLESAFFTDLRSGSSGIPAHPVLDVVVDDEVQLFVSEPVVFSKNTVDFVDDWLGFLDRKRLRFCPPRLLLVPRHHAAVGLQTVQITGTQFYQLRIRKYGFWYGKFIDINRVQIAQIRGDGVPPPENVAAERGNERFDLLFKSGRKRLFSARTAPFGIDEKCWRKISEDLPIQPPGCTIEHLVIGASREVCNHSR